MGRRPQRSAPPPPADNPIQREQHERKPCRGSSRNEPLLNKMSELTVLLRFNDLQMDFGIFSYCLRWLIVNLNKYGTLVWDIIKAKDGFKKYLDAWLVGTGSGLGRMKGSAGGGGGGAGSARGAGGGGGGRSTSGAGAGRGSSTRGAGAGRGSSNRGAGAGSSTIGGGGPAAGTYPGAVSEAVRASRAGPPSSRTTGTTASLRSGIGVPELFHKNWKTWVRLPGEK